MKKLLLLSLAHCIVMISAVAGEANGNVLFAPDFLRDVKQNAHLSVAESDGIPELIVTRKEAGSVYADFPVDTELIAGKKIVLSGDVAYENISKVPHSWQGVKLMLVLTKANGQLDYLQPIAGTGSAPYHRLGREIVVPPDIRKANIALGLKDASGIVRFRNVRLTGPSGVVVRNWVLDGYIDRENAIYRPEETMQFFFRLSGKGNAPAGTLRITRRGEDRRQETKHIPIRCSETVAYRTSLAQPGFVMVRAELLDGNGIPMKNIEYGLGAGVLPERLQQAVAEPEDFDAFWAEKLADLAKTPVKVLEKKPVRKNSFADLFDVKIACTGGRPVSGYLSIPRNAKAKSLPLEVCFDGYSVQSATEVSRPGMLILSINPHGIENGREKSYYQALAQGELKHYGFRDAENQSRDTSYFLGMLLRSVRAVEFATTLPEWNGKDLTLSGSSQGGLQAIAATALTQKATSCQVKIPWFCDLGMTQPGRVRGWLPKYTPALGYFDTVNFASRIHCPVSVMGGLSDYVCPPSGVQVLYNHLKGPAELKMVQGLNHAFYAGFRGRKNNAVGIFHK
ncbi:MAG: acetylxylan esterase [Victivallaceae bacterium]|nr:acetylxylan esterase [Victivallaceae bacterium]